MKKLLLSLLLLVYGEGVLLLAQNKYQPKYLREDNKAFKELTTRASNMGSLVKIEENKNPKIGHK